MKYTLKDISKSPASTILANVTRGELVTWIVKQDAWRAQLTPDFMAAAWGNDTQGYAPAKYVPTFFDKLAMNANDKRSLTGTRYTVVPTAPTFPQPDQALRQYMVLDETGRVVDVREWLSDCRNELRRQANETHSPITVSREGFKAKEVYRKTTGFRQALATPLQPDEDWYELVGNVPSRLTRKPRGNAMTGMRIRSVSKSWKDNPGRTRNWQRNTRGHMPASKVVAPIDFEALCAELLGA